MSWLATKTVSAFLLPPFNLLLLSGLGLLLLSRRPRLGRALIITAWLLLYGLSTSFVGGALLQSLEHTPPLPLENGTTNKGDAIVVLSGGVYCSAPEYGGDNIAGSVLERLRYAARLYRATGKPILVSGGKPQSTIAESTIMKEVLENDFHVPVQWVEDQSINTLENAHLSAALLQQHGIHTIYLVTHSWHMPRAVSAFEKAGFTVVPAPTIFTTQCRINWLDFLPSSRALQMSSRAAHEWIGQLWYRLREGWLF